MRRRDLVKMLGTGGAVVAVASPALVTAAIVSKPKRDPLPPLQAGDILTASYFADLVNRVNELDGAS